MPRLEFLVPFLIKWHLQPSCPPPNKVLRAPKPPVEDGTKKWFDWVHWGGAFCCDALEIGPRVPVCYAFGPNTHGGPPQAQHHGAARRAHDIHRHASQAQGFGEVADFVQGFQHAVNGDVRRAGNARVFVRTPPRQGRIPRPLLGLRHRSPRYMLQPFALLSVAQFYLSCYSLFFRRRGSVFRRPRRRYHLLRLEQHSRC